MNTVRAMIISIGNELLNGRTVNSNATYISGKLFDIGIATKEAHTIGDSAESIAASLKAALEKSDIVLITGGLGPTHDDITKKVVADFFDSRMIFDDAVVRHIEKLFQGRGLKMPDINREQGNVPEKARLIRNSLGTAPGMHFHEGGKHVFVMPGVPREMRGMMESDIIPFLSSEYRLQPSEVRLYRTTRIPESAIYERCKDFLADFPDLEIAFLPKFTGVDIRLILPPGEVEPRRLAEFDRLLTGKIGKYLYTTDDEEIYETVGKLLKKQGLTLAVAESCTGGLIQQQLTSVPGSSEYFVGGVVSYSNESKMELLGVQEASLREYGAVSETVAREMAAGVCRRLSADVSISTTGVAGPAGGTVEKPVGLIFVGLAAPDGEWVQKFNLGKDRHINQEQTAIFALDMLRRWLQNVPL